MRQSSSYNNKRPPDPIVTSTSLSKSSLNSSSSSLSPSASTYFAGRTTPTPSPSSNISRNNYRTNTTTARDTKLEQIIQNFYNKTAQIIIQSRIPNLKAKNSGVRRRKLNKWFNITTNDSESLKEDLKFWKSFIKYQQEEEPPPLVIDIYVETTEPELLQEGNDTDGWHKLDFGIQHQRILIESWTLTLNHPIPDFPVDLPNLYKRSIVFFRSLHSLVRILPSFKLYQKLRLHSGEITLGYRLSATRSKRLDEISFDHPLSNADTISLYEFKDIVTPLGVFKLNLSYREHCQFGTKEESPLHGIDVEENFFTPTMTKYRQEQKDSTDFRQPAMYPSSSSSSARSRIHSYRSTVTPTTSRSNNPIHSMSTNTALERRISAPLVSPFKSPSLSSSPQAELMYASRSDRSTTSFGRKTEFSSSFEKFFKSGSSSHIHKNTAADMATTRRWSRASDHSSINMDSEEDEEGLQDFMNFIGARQELKLFSTQLASHQHIATEEMDSKSLSHFRSIQVTHNLLSDSMSMSQQIPKQSMIEPMSQDSSSSSLNKQLNLPAIPSPLHNTESHHPLSHFRKVSEDNRLNFGAQMDVVKVSPLKNRQAPPLPPPPRLPQHRTSGGDDDDSLVFKMSELSGYDENVASSGHSHSFYFGPKQKDNNNLRNYTTGVLSDTTNHHRSSSEDNMTRQFFYGN